jgi:protein-disulfide isomerase
MIDTQNPIEDRMTVNRRTLLLTLAATPAMAMTLARVARADAPPSVTNGTATPSVTNNTATPSVDGRSVGDPKAPITVMEFYSLTCPHCARFAMEVFPTIQDKLIKTGKLRWVFREFPLDRLALMASQVALTLGDNQYLPFIDLLFHNQDKWAFAQGINYTDELFKYAALAGMSRPAYDAAISNTALQNAILAEQQTASDKFKIDSTPSFIWNDQKRAGEMTYDDFAKWIGVTGT